MEQLKTLRNEIDELDKTISGAFTERMKVSAKIGEIKKENGIAVDDPKRENDALYNVLSPVEDSLKPYVKELYKTIFSTSKAYQRELINADSPSVRKIKELDPRDDIDPVATVACQGIEGANSETAVKRLVDVPRISFFKNFDGVFTAVDKGFCKYGVLPIENSASGSVLEVYDLINRHKFFIVKSIKIKIEHCLAVKRDANEKNIAKVLSHPQALKQCSAFIKEAGYEAVESTNTAVSAKTVADGDDRTVACICSVDCAESYGLKIVKRNIENKNDNFTRFILISKDMTVLKGSDRVSIVTSLPHKVGSLSELLNKFSLAGLNLTKIESRPLNSDFEFLFYLEFSGNVFNKKVLSLIAELENGSQYFEFLGSYKETV